MLDLERTKEPNFIEHVRKSLGNITGQNQSIRTKTSNSNFKIEREV